MFSGIFSSCHYYIIYDLIDFILAYSDTIRYKKQQEEVQDDGTTKANIVEVEKQTTPDRLGRVKWDEEKSWRLLQ